MLKDAKGVEILEEDKTSIVRCNMLQDRGYRPYCGSTNYQTCSSPRLKWDSKRGQMVCPECGWVSQYPDDFIQRYKVAHNLK